MPDLISATAAMARASHPGAALGTLTGSSRGPGMAAVVAAGLVCCDSVKADPLCKLDLRTKVGRARLAAHVRLPRVGARLAPAAGFLFAAEGPADLGAAGADVDVGDAAVAPAARGGQERLRGPEAVGEDRRGEAL